MLNKVLLIGRLTSQPELKYTESEKAYTRICVAVNRYNEGTDFINVVVWNKQAENVCNYLEKGSLVMVEGNISVNSYDDKEGNKRTSTEVMAQNVKFLSKKTSGDSETESVDSNSSFDEFEEQVTIDDNFLD